MQVDAAQDRIRSAYRERARQLHPDRGATDTREMAALNEAYRVLSDPGRRAMYDRSLRGPAQAGGGPPDEDDFDDSWFDVDHLNRDDGMDAIRRSSPLSPPGPARVPWKLMLVSAVIGTAVVLVAATFNDPPSEEPPDGILRPGSCVEIEINGDAREVACAGDDDVVVEVLVPTSARCPTGTLGHRDRLGLGIACVRE